MRVSVVVSGHEADSFEATSPDTLRPELRALYTHLPHEATTVRFTGVEDEELPLGLRRRRVETALAGPRAALAFLGGKPTEADREEREPNRQPALARDK